MHPKYQKQIPHKGNELSMHQTGRKTTRSVKKNKNIFINVNGDNLPWVLDEEN